jgi:hypothetical protein
MILMEEEIVTLDNPIQIGENLYGTEEDDNLGFAASLSDDGSRIAAQPRLSSSSVPYKFSPI